MDMLYFFFLNQMSFLQRISFPFRIMFATPPLDFTPGKNVLVKETLATGLNALYPRHNSFASCGLRFLHPI